MNTPLLNRRQSVRWHIWEEVLEVPQIGRHDHFFECGGHSLRGMKMLNRLYEEMQVELTLKSLFESPTLEAFALVVDQAEQKEIKRVESGRGGLLSSDVCSEKTVRSGEKNDRCRAELSYASCFKA